MRRRFPAIAVLLAAELLTPRVVFAWPNNPVKIKIAVPFNGVVYHPGTGEHVSISGGLNVKTTINFTPSNPVFPNDPIYPPNPVKVTTSYKVVKGITAIGQTSGDFYTIKGAGKTQFLWPNDPVYPNDPIRTLTHDAVLRMFPNAPILPVNPIRGFRVQYQMNFDNNANLTGLKTAIVPDSYDACATVAQVCSAEQPLVTPSLCTDGLVNQDETDVDCGGAACDLRCQLGAGCVAGGDCETTLCEGGACVACLSYGATCSVSADCCSSIPCISNHCVLP